MRQASTELEFATRGQGLVEVTREIAAWVDAQGIETGMLTVFCRHTSASLTIQENADPDVQRDLETFFSNLVAEDPRLYRHTAEGADDMPAHMKSMITGPSLLLPITNGSLALGTWQGIYLCEHRDHGGPRSLVATLSGESSSGT